MTKKSSHKWSDEERGDRRRHDRERALARAGTGELTDAVGEHQTRR